MDSVKDIIKKSLAVTVLYVTWSFFSSPPTWAKFPFFLFLFHSIDALIERENKK